ncbi:TetR/AcrR family transcriptional regulator C-terminal domain-containing protein [Nocardia sp. CA-120079]|uniref:TetR/AcrR family transcriptional regulator C-terminal domain-containing protein n=1 Tax=Nocardia sp. CA-120079 TaxID=3239974 RepID=UPI003D975E44
MSGEKFDGTDAGKGSGRGRGRGRPRQISRGQIVAAARSVAPEALTMQAVAAVLGVDPTSLNYHVGGKEGLRELVALDVFESELRRVALPTDGDWRDVVQSYATALRDAVVEVGAMVTYLQLPNASGLAVLAPVEHVLQALVDAGFDIAEARGALMLITDTASSAGRDLLRARHGGNPNVPELASALAEAAEADFPVLRQVVAVSENASRDGGDDRLAFNVSVIIAGLQQLLSSRTSGGRR